jgi:hypothetical protein
MVRSKRLFIWAARTSRENDPPPKQISIRRIGGAEGS